MMLVGFLGILSGDSLIYLAGRRIGDRASSGSGFFARVITPEKRAKVEALFARHGQKIVMIARFLPGVRAVTYFTAGSARMSYGRFIFWDGLAAIVSAPLFVYLGFKFGNHLRYVMHRIRQGQKMVIIALLIAAACYAVVYAYRRSRAARLAALANPQLPPPGNGPAGTPPTGDAGMLESDPPGRGSSQGRSQDPPHDSIDPLK
jgi:membrane protein DedA with SNARE-associated domain